MTLFEPSHFEGSFLSSRNVKRKSLDHETIAGDFISSNHNSTVHVTILFKTMALYFFLKLFDIAQKTHNTKVRVKLT